MKQFNGYKEAKDNAKFEGGGSIPEGAYVCKVLGVKYFPGENGNSDYITIQFDIEEGEYKGFFRNKHDSDQNEDKKWKGKVNVWVPKDDGTREDGWTKNTFARWTAAFEDSNSGYTWDWDESKWKNKLIGIIFGSTGTVIRQEDGTNKEIVYTEARNPVSVDKVRSGNYRPAKFKARNGYKGNGGSGSDTNVDKDGFMVMPEGSETDLPFE